MRRSNGWQQVISPNRTPGRSRSCQVKYRPFFPQDGLFRFYDVRTEQASDRSIRTVHERAVYPLECGCLVHSEKGISGPCVRGLLVCYSHAKNCPLNSIDPNFDWVNAPRIRPCLRGCGWRIWLLRLAHWLVTPPVGSGGK